MLPLELPVSDGCQVDCEGKTEILYEMAHPHVEKAYPIAEPGEGGLNST
jgi:hypothetical protein